MSPLFLEINRKKHRGKDMQFPNSKNISGSTERRWPAPGEAPRRNALLSSIYARAWCDILGWLRSQPGRDLQKTLLVLRLSLSEPTQLCQLQCFKGRLHDSAKGFEVDAPRKLTLSLSRWERPGFIFMKFFTGGQDQQVPILVFFYRGGLQCSRPYTVQV